jgi:outer membrane protein assembly factor BamE
MRLALLVLTATLAAACVHKIDVEQGNFVTTDMVDKLQPGMTKAQVKQILGTPLLSDVFHANRWDYYFDNAKSGKHLAHKKLTIVFRDDKLESVTGDANPPLPPPKRLEPPPGAAAPPAATK